MPRTNRFANPFQTKNYLRNRQFSRFGIIFQGFTFVQGLLSQPPLTDAATLLEDPACSAGWSGRPQPVRRFLARIYRYQRIDGSQHVTVGNFGILVKYSCNSSLDVLKDARVFTTKPPFAYKDVS
jgi:hypothetical protein